MLKGWANQLLMTFFIDLSQPRSKPFGQALASHPDPHSETFLSFRFDKQMD